MRERVHAVRMVRGALGSPLGRALAALLLIVVVGCIFHRDGAFFAWATHQGTLREVAVTGILACGMTVVVVAGGIDLAVGSNLALAAVVFATLTMPRQWPAVAAIAAVLAIGAAMGTAAGAIVARFRLQPFIVTLAAMVFARGLAKHVADGKKVTHFANGVSVAMPRVFDLLDARVLRGSVAVVTLVFFAAVAATWVLLARTRLGRWWYATGGNVEAARLAGVPVLRVTILAYAWSGLLAAVAGICQAAQETHGDPETGLGYELDAIAMVVIGGTSLSGGRGGVGLTLLGALTIGTLQKILSINAFSTEARLMLTGAIIVGAALFQRRRA
ncbi:MAG: ABC transporter permease [Polyangiales bacterium]